MLSVYVPSESSLRKATETERAAVRNKAREMGVWPPPGGSDTLLTMANKIMMPAAFSPVQ